MPAIYCCNLANISNSNTAKTNQFIDRSSRSGITIQRTQAAVDTNKLAAISVIFEVVE